MKNKKLLIIILAFIFVTTITYTFSTIKTEAPKIPNQIATEEETTPEQIIKPVEKTANVEKYIIINRSVISPKDILNKKKIVLLTIDDGPSSRTKEMVDILNKHNAKAIFFINGMHNKGYPGVIENTFKEGFSIGNHTWNHLNLKNEKNINVIEKEINNTTNLITKITGEVPRFFRAPYGESNTYIRKLIKDDGMIFMDWSGAAKDWDKSTIEKDIFVNNVMENIHSGSIILIHEHPWSVANLDALLTTIESKGYTYVDPKNIIEE
jgi:peptidoglycan/xylan/chitin deacetylase (PgdA/CDA1 family)